MSKVYEVSQAWCEKVGLFICLATALVLIVLTISIGQLL